MPSCKYITLDASDGPFEGKSVAGSVENEKEKFRLNMCCQHGKIPYAEFTRLR